MLVHELGVDMTPTGKMVVAIDAVGSGTGEVVLYASGSSARQTTVTRDRPVDATIMAIVDTLEVSGETRYDKSTS
jgi:microcompartment protein CcmK/EutM